MICYRILQVLHPLGVVQNVEVMAEVEFDSKENNWTQVVTLSDAGDGGV